MTFFISFTKNGIFKLTKCGLSLKLLLLLFIVPFLGPALGYYDSAMCSPGWENLVAFDWNDLPVDRDLD